MSELNSEQITFDQASCSTECSEEECEKILDELMKEYAEDDSRGIEVANYGGVYRFLSKEYVIDSAKRLFQLNKQATLSPAAMETLAIIAYKQPITRVEIEEIRGVGADMMLRKLLARDLIQEAGRSEAPGRPILYEVTNEFLNSLMIKARELYPFFSNEKEYIDAKYITFIDLDGDMKEAYAKVFEKEKKYHQTLIGIHRDDILFELNGKAVCEVASQGQKRSFVLALKLGLAQIIYEKSGQYPILLLDDVFSELDNLRKRQLIEKLPNDMQIFITTTERLNMHWNREVRFYDIEQGRIKEVYK